MRIFLFHVALLFLLTNCQAAFGVPTPTVTPEPIVPTATVPSLATVAPEAVGGEETAVLPTPSPVATAAPHIDSDILPANLLDRFGVLSAASDIDPAQAAGLPFGTVLNWNISDTLPDNPNFTFWQMIRLEEAGVRTDWEAIAAVVASHPSSVWIVGNEPDVKWQDNVTPARYAELYHEAYTFIKERDPAAVLASGGISQSTPLRRAYLDQVLAAYRATFGEPMPVDMWTIHAFTLREERDSWGVDIPPGMETASGELYEIEDHDDIALFQQNIIDFRAWMAANGYQERPLAITEYGILLPSDYGFPDEVVVDFMHQSFDFMLTANNETGYGADNGRLVQHWFWYMVHDSGQYPTGNLYQPESGQLTAVGAAYAAYVDALLSK